MRNPNVFANSPLDRASDKRADAAWNAARAADSASRVLPLWRLKPFLLPGPKGLEIGWLKPGLAEPLAGPGATRIFLGLDGDAACFALDLSAARDPDHSGPLAGLGAFKELRAAAMEGLAPGDAAILAQAKALIDWHARHRFCAACGAPTALAEAGYKRVCGACKAEHFPRTDPVVIMLATDGERCLLGRQPQFPRGMFSALAGYVEPGETIEEAVRRELFEEAGIRTGAVRYHSTQPWPFPSSLMIGCFAEASTHDIVVDGVEIVEARWFEKNDIRAALAGGEAGFRAPPPLAIAHQLLRAWADR